MLSPHDPPAAGDVPTALRAGAHAFTTAQYQPGNYRMLKRRDFLTASAATGAALLLPNRSLTADEPQRSEPVSVGLVGLGTQGRALMNSLVRIPGVRIAAICDMWEYARRFGRLYLRQYAGELPTYGTFQEMLDKEASLDAVVIATPDFVHGEQAIACLEAGKHVYCEPPLAHDAENARRMVQAMKRTGKLLQVGYQRRSNPRYQHIAEKLLKEAQLLGRINSIQTQWALPWTEARGFPRRSVIPDEELAKFGYANMHEFRNWRWFPKYCCSPFCSFVAHQLDVCDWYLNAPPRTITAVGDATVYSDRPCLDNVIAIYEFAGQKGTVLTTSQLLTASSGGGMQHYERFLGTDGSIQVSLDPRWTRIGREATAPSWDDWVQKRFLSRPEVSAVADTAAEPAEVRVSSEIEPYTLPIILDDPYCQPHLVNFFQAVRGEEQLNCPADVALRSHVAAVKTVAAATTQEPLTLEVKDYEA